MNPPTYYVNKLKFWKFSIESSKNFPDTLEDRRGKKFRKWKNSGAVSDHGVSFEYVQLSNSIR